MGDGPPHRQLDYVTGRHRTDHHSYTQLDTDDLRMTVEGDLYVGFD